MAEPATLSFLDLARLVIENERRPLTASEIWSIAERSGLVSRLATTGKTPKATLGARLYTLSIGSNSQFARIGARPARFVLRAMSSVIPQELMDPENVESSTFPGDVPPYKERELHPLAVYFANSEFGGTRCKTIFHEKSTKQGQKHHEWLHPDIVGFQLITEGWEQQVATLARSLGPSAAKLYSFELKRCLDFSTLREYFFQAVSNSSWANEGYLVAAEIDDDKKLRDELERLSGSFGIGVIRLNLKTFADSEVLLRAQVRANLDWETINLIAEVNPDFRNFIECVTNSIKINQVIDKDFDPVLQEAAVLAYVENLKKDSPIAGKTAAAGA